MQIIEILLNVAKYIILLIMFLNFYYLLLIMVLFLYLFHSSGTVEDQLSTSLCRKLLSIGWSVSQTVIVQNDVSYYLNNLLVLLVLTQLCYIIFFYAVSAG